MHLPGVHKGDDLREVLSAENLTEVFRGVNRLNSQQQQPFATAASGSVYARIFSKSKLTVGSVVRLTKDAYISESMDYAVCVDTPVSMDDDPHQVLGIVVKDLRAGERGKAVVSGIAIGSVNVSDTSHQFAKVENGKLVSTDEEDAPIRLISAPGTGSQLCVLMLGFGSSHSKDDDDDDDSPKGPFDSRLFIEEGSDGFVTKLECYDSSYPDSPLAGYWSPFTHSVARQVFTVSSPGFLFLDVTYEPSTREFTSLVKYESVLPSVTNVERRFVLLLAYVYFKDNAYHIGEHRNPGNVTIANRWL